MIGVGAATDGAEAIEGRHADRCGEVAVAAPADGDAADSSRPAAAAADRATAKRLAEADSGIGGRSRPPVTSTPAPGTSLASVDISRSTRSFSPAATTRASTRTRVNAGTTLSAVPAVATVGVTVVPVSGSPKVAILVINCAAATSELIPFSGSRPAWAARPCTITSNVPVPLRAGLQRAAVGAGLEHQHGAARQRPLLDQRPRRLRADLLVGGDQQLDTVEIVEQRQRVDRLDDARLHVEHTRTGCPAVVDGERSGSEGADREHRVVVADDQHPRRGAEAGVNVWTGVALDQLGFVAEPALDHVTNCTGRSGDGLDVVRRRLDRHEVLQIGQHRVE